jgi:dTDP-4-amino-4,6-dideoxygalactose transaminase
MPELPQGRSTRWLTCITIDPEQFGATREDVRLALERENIESRPVWKPMHLQPAFAGCRCRGGDVARRLFEQGLCLPSGSNLDGDDLARIVQTIRATGKHRLLTASSVDSPSHHATTTHFLRQQQANTRPEHSAPR